MKKENMTYEDLGVVLEHDQSRAVLFTVGDHPEDFYDPFEDAIPACVFTVYGVPYGFDFWEDEDFLSLEKIGTITGSYISNRFITDLGFSPYDVCDSMSSDLEAMCSVAKSIKGYREASEEIFYIHEIEILPEFQNMGYEKELLKKLPAVLVKTMQVKPTLLIHFPAVVNVEALEPEGPGAIVSHAVRYVIDGFLKDEDDNTVMIPPSRALTPKELNYVMGRRNDDDAVPEENRDQAKYALYQSAGFKEIGKTGWLYRRLRGDFLNLRESFGSWG